MATTLIEWHSHKFEVASDAIRVFNDLAVSGTCETEEKEASKEKYVSLKNRKPAEITLTAILSAYFGCDVQNEVMTFVDEAQKGTSALIYANGGKLLGCKMMLTSAKATKIDIAPGGKWTHAQVALTFKQATKADGTTSSSSGGGSSGGGSSSKSSGGGSSGKQYGTPWQSLIGTSSVFAAASEEKAKQGAIEYANSQAAKDAAKAALISTASKPISPSAKLSAITKAATSSKSSSSSSSSSSKAASAVAKVSSVVSKVVSKTGSTKVTVKKK